MSEETLALLTLVRAPLLPAQRRHLLERHGNALAAVRAGPTAWRAAGVPAKAFAALVRPGRGAINADLDWLQGPGRRLLAWGEADYPALLARSEDPPAALFVEGDADLLWFPQIAIVGSRHPTPAGSDAAHRFATRLAAAGLTVTSGLAAGVDTRAHAGALGEGRTVAVIGTGPDRCFPSGNSELMARIAAAGAVVSEYPPGTEGFKANFPARNRIIAGLSLGTLVVEAAQRSGALITARLAAQAGREVFAVPGSIHNPLAQGCHRLIRQGAALVETPDEVLEGVAGMAQALADCLRARLRPPPTDSAHEVAEANTPLAPAQHAVLQALGAEPTPLDLLAERSGLTLPRLSAILLAMELDGRVSADNGRYRRLS